MEELDTSGWLHYKKVPFSDDEIKEVVQYVRASPCRDQDRDRKLRIQVKIPDDKKYGYVLGDCFIGGDPL